MPKALRENLKFLLFSFLIFSISSMARSQEIRTTPRLSEQAAQASGNRTLALKGLGGLSNPILSEGDFNFDGLVDLFVFDPFSDRFLFLFKTSSGFQVSYPEGNWPEIRDYARLLDANCDGIADLFTNNAGTLLYYKGSMKQGQLQFNSAAQRLDSFYELSTQSFTAPIFVNTLDVPALIDIDGDGDLDVLSVSSTGVRIEFHENLSMDRNGLCGFDFEAASGCYGHIIESGSWELGIEKCPLSLSRSNQKHSGSNLFIDTEAKELLFGELDKDTVFVFELSPDQFGIDSAISISAFPDSSSDLNPNFPAIYSYEDLRIIGPGKDENIPGLHPLKSYQKANGSWSLANDNFLLSESIDLGHNPFLAEEANGTWLSLSEISNQEKSLNRLRINKDSIIWVDSNLCADQQEQINRIDFIAAFENDWLISVDGQIQRCLRGTTSCSFDFSSAENILPKFEEKIAAVPVNLGSQGEFILVTGYSGWIKTYQKVAGGYAENSSLLAGIEQHFPSFNNSRPWPSLSAAPNPILHLRFIDGSMLSWPLSGGRGAFVRSDFHPSIGRAGFYFESDNNGWVASKSGGILGLEESPKSLLSANELILWPNPGKAGFKLNLSGEKVSVYDLQGRLILEENNYEAAAFIELDVKSGCYLVEITNEGKSQSTKWIAIE